MPETVKKANSFQLLWKILGVVGSLAIIIICISYYTWYIAVPGVESIASKEAARQLKAVELNLAEVRGEINALKLRVDGIDRTLADEIKQMRVSIGQIREDVSFIKGKMSTEQANAQP